MICALPNRLKAIADLINQVDLVADVGTDHGLLPIYLIQNQIAKKVYASDIAILPLNKAKENIAKYGLNEKIYPILSDGLKAIPFDVEVVVIAGMGGHLIANIIQHRQVNYPTLILQANSHVEILRKELMNASYEIVNEKIVLDKGKYYEIIKAQISSKKINYSDIDLKYGPILLQNKDDLFIKKYKTILHQYETILKELNKDSNDFYTIKNKIQEIRKIMS